MTDARFGGNALPVAAALLKQRADFGVEICAHGAIIANFCESGKQHIAGRLQETATMSRKSINEVVADALRYYMGDRWTNVALAKASGVAEGTIRNYLSPGKRESGKTGKEPSAKVTELAKIADALNVRVVDLMMSPSDACQPVAAIDQALEVLGIELAREMAAEVRQDVADALSKLALRRGAARDQRQVLDLLNAPPSKQTGT